MKLSRKEWLKKFLELFDNNMPTIAYRKHLRIMGRDINAHVKRVDKYREELKTLEREEEKLVRLERMRADRQARLIKERIERERLAAEAAMRAEEENDGREDEQGDGEVSGSD